MFGKILKQQISLLFYDNSVILFSFIALLIGISPFQELIILKETKDWSSLLSTVFNPFILCFGLFLISLIASLNNDKFRLNDLLITKTRISITESIVIRTMLIQLIIWSIWTITSLITIMLSGLGFFILSANFQILILYLYAYFSMLLLSIMQLSVLVIANNKILAFLVAFGINCIEYYLLKIKIDYLIYYFTTPKSLLGISVRLFILMILSGIFIAISHKTILKKDL